MKVKTLSRSDWPRILERAQAFMPFEREGLKGWAGLIEMKRVTAPLAVPVLGERLTIADEGFRWLQIAPEDENWWLTVMFNRTGETVQYYFDVSLRNEIDGVCSRFSDLYLDVVLLPDGRLALLDADELDEALAEGAIAPEEHALAVRTADGLMQSIPGNRKCWKRSAEKFLTSLFQSSASEEIFDAKFRFSLDILQMCAII